MDLFHFEPISKVLLEQLSYLFLDSVLLWNVLNEHCVIRYLRGFSLMEVGIVFSKLFTDVKQKEELRDE